MTLNEQLKKLIEENTTQAEVAKKMGIHRQTLNDSLRRDMRLTKFEKIVDALGYKVVFVKKQYCESAQKNRKTCKNIA